MEQKKKDSNGNGQGGNSQALAPAAKKVQAVVVNNKNGDKKPDMREVLADRIGDFIRLAGVLQRLEGGLPKQAEAYEKVSGSVNELACDITMLQGEVRDGNRQVTADVATNISKMKDSIAKMDSYVLGLTESVKNFASGIAGVLSNQLDKKLAPALAEHEKKFTDQVALLRHDARYDRWLFRTVVGLFFAALLVFAHADYRRRAENEELRQRLDQLIELQRSPDAPGAEAPPAAPKKKSGKKSNG